MATASRNPWDADPVVPQQAPWASDPVVSAKNPWDNDPTVAAPAAPATPTAAPRSPAPVNPDANLKKFLDFLGKAEGADYDVIVGGGRFTDFRAHPRIAGMRTKEGVSTAAGKYQITATTYDDVAKRLGITDFSPASQDRIAIELIRRKGALEDVRSGNFNAAIGKLGGTWASLPSSPYSQPKKSQEWVDKVLGGETVSSPSKYEFKNFAPVRQNVDPKSLNKDEDWLRASMLMYSFWERKNFEGTKDELAEWGKDSLGQFNFNLVSMAEIGYALTNATQEEKEAFLYMMDTYDNTNFSLEGTGRALKGIATDPTNLIGFGTLGMGFVGKLAGKQAAKEGIRQVVIDSLARTGIAAGIQGGVFGAADSTIRQGVEVTAGRREEIDLSKVGVDTAISGTAGVVLGTAADAALTKIIATVKGPRGVDTPTVDGTVPAEKTVVPPGATGTSQTPNVSGVDPTGAPVTSIPSGVVTEATVRSETGQPVVLYHGTKQSEPFDQFDLSKTGSNTDNDGYWGKGVNLTEDRETAGNYSLFDNSGNEVEGGRVIATVADLQKPFEVVNDGNLESRLLALEGWTEKEQQIIRQSGGWLTGDIPGERVTKVLQDNGYDGVIVRGGKFFDDGTGTGTIAFQPMISEVVVFDPKNVKILDQGIRSTGRDPNLGSTLTPSEIAEATSRQQQGRLDADNTVPNVGDNVPKVDVPEMNTGLRTTPMSMEQLTKLGEAIVTQLRGLGDKDLTAALEGVRTASLPFEEMRIVARGVQMYADELRIEKAELLKKINANPGSPEVPAMLTRLEAIDARLAPLSMADDAFGSMAGSILRQRQEGLPGVQGVTVESIMAEQGLSRADAEKVWADMVGKAAVDAEGRRIAAQYDEIAGQAIENGDLAAAARAAVLKQRELDAKVEALAPKSASLVDKMTELAISNVFSIKTILINIIPSGLKTLVIPGIKAIMSNPFEKATRVEAAAAYSAMRSSFGAALKSAVAGYRYEQALITRDGVRLVEGEMALTGKLGGALRLFPRLLNASDEFLSKINYDSFVAGRAAAEAAIEGTEKGLKGKALDEFIDKATKKALDASMKPVSGDELVIPIINKGLNLGLTGEDLFKFVEREAARDPASLRKGNDEDALNFVRDVLYKRKFSGENNLSQAAQTYEETMKKFPTLKLVIGQLFFRTPVRVFEEGIRLTPGLQFLAPNFMADLQGANGSLRQVRAQSEAMASLVIASAVLSLYGQGRIVGDGAYTDYRQQKNRTDGPQAEPYTIKLSDGSTWSYRGFDPLATPVKIMVNALNRMDQLRLREAQGEFVDKAAYKQALAAVTVATMSVASAIRDASLVEGADNFIKFLESFADPEEASWIKLMGDKLFLLVPNTLHKIARENDPQIRDPQNFWQMVEQKLLRPFGMESPEEKAAFAYDVLGNVRKMADTGALWNVFSTATVEERAKGMSPEAQFVMTEMDRLSRVTGVTFKSPIKHRDFGETDMRTIMAADGKRTLYDVWQQNYKALNPEATLYSILSSPLPEGTFKYRAAKVEEVQSTISAMQDAAFAITMAQEQKVIDKFISTELQKAKAKAGLFDTPRPY